MIISDLGERHIPMPRIYRPHSMIAFVNNHIIPDAVLWSFYPRKADSLKRICIICNFYLRHHSEMKGR